MIRIAFSQRECNPFFVALFLAFKSIAPSFQKHSSQPPKALLSASKVNALGF
jgi:hypothetical protein